MVTVRRHDADAFSVVGSRTWIPGQDSEPFFRFWEECRQDGTLDRLEQIRGPSPGPVTGGVLLGVSRVERRPRVRRFFYYIGVEVAPESGDHEVQGTHGAGLERFVVPAASWAVFGERGRMPDVLVECEMYAFEEWLPESGLSHAMAPELEVYLPTGPEPEEAGIPVEFWLPVTPK
ncbi:MAG: hypothetical protein GXX79_22505 [Actinomycetales bacterium]|nr:hypothetical protein [Actinomycetales bacterium]